MTREERFSKLKQFYLKAYPITKYFYDNFGKQNMKSSETAEPEELPLKMAKCEETEEPPKESKIDYYENVSTFEGVLDLLPMSPRAKSDAEEDMVEKVFENFLNKGTFKLENDITDSPKFKRFKSWPRKTPTQTIKNDDDDEEEEDSETVKAEESKQAFSISNTVPKENTSRNNNSTKAHYLEDSYLDSLLS